MMTFIRCAALALMLIPTPNAAQDFDAGFHAYESGDYAAALREWGRNLLRNLMFLLPSGLKCNIITHSEDYERQWRD